MAKQSTLNIKPKYFLFTAPLVVIAVLILFFTTVDLTPKVTPDFFFSSSSEIYQQNKKIREEFPSQQQILVNVTAPQGVADENHVAVIEVLTKRIKTIKGVKNVQSITNGPDDIEAATENPLWRRILIGNNEKSSFLIVFLETDKFEALIKELETITKQEETKTYKTRIAGLPYIVEQIRRNLESDMKTFTLGAIILSALVLFAVFRSYIVVIGAIITCATAAMLALIIQSAFGIPIGILTANLGAIIFVLTLSHIIFLVANWCNAAKQSKNAKFRETLKTTLPASFWAGLTTLLGFSSLIFVEAKPLNQLGIGGSIGTIAAFACAYTIFPAFLRLSKVDPSSFSYKVAKKFPLNKKWARSISVVLILTALGIGSVGILRLNTDPSLLAYFDEDSKLYNGLYHVDKNGGSNPLLIVVRQQNGQELDNDEAYKKMWNLQKGFNDHEAVGSVVSLPVIMAEGDEHWLGSIIPWNLLLDILSRDQFGGIAKSFMSDDRTKALFMLRMKENNREKDRLSIIEEIEKIPAKHGFKHVNTGGTYYLQGELASAVAQSMIIGIISLVILFTIIAFFVSGKIMVALAVGICASVISAIVVGTLGVLSIPVDIISSPSINICLGIIVDSMFHLTLRAKRFVREEKEKSLREFETWRKALNSQSWPAIISTTTIMIGFSVFAFSGFPPSQRFGLEIVYGAGIAVILALVVFPYLCTRLRSKTLQKVKREIDNEVSN